MPTWFREGEHGKEEEDGIGPYSLVGLVHIGRGLHGPCGIGLGFYSLMGLRKDLGFGLMGRKKD